ALAKSRDERYASAAEMAQALRSAAADTLGHSVAVATPGPVLGGPTGPTLQRNAAVERALKAPTKISPPTQAVNGAEPTIADQPPPRRHAPSPTGTVVLPAKRRGRRAAAVVGVALVAGALILVTVRFRM